MILTSIYQYHSMRAFRIVGAMLLLMLFALGFARADRNHLSTDNPESATVSFFRGTAERTGVFEGTGPGNREANKLWTFSTKHARIEGSPVIRDSVVYISARNDHLYAVDIRTGTEIWRSDSTGYFRSSPCVSGEMIYIGNEDHHLYAFDVSGNIRWMFRTEGSVRAAPLVINNVVYFGSIDNVGYSRFDYKTDSVQTRSKFYALDAETGNQLWEFAPEGGLRSSPAFSDNSVYVGSWDGNLYALDAASGALRWSFKTGDKVYSTPAIKDGMVVFGSNDNYLYALSVIDGSERWRFDLGSDGVNDFIPRISSPAVHDGRVFIGSLNGDLYALDLEDGIVIWNFETDDKIGSSPAIADDIVYFGSDDGSIYALDADDGNLVWKYATGHPIGTSSPFIRDGKLFIGTMGGELIAIE